MLLKADAYYLLSVTGNPHPLFSAPDRYDQFLKQFAGELSQFSSIYAYCLVPPEAAMLVRFPEAGVASFFREKGQLHPTFDPFTEPAGAHLLSTLLRNRISLLLKAFQESAQHKVANSITFTGVEQQQCRDIVQKIHGMAADHQLADWKFSSLSALRSELPTRLQRDEVRSWFGSSAVE